MKNYLILAAVISAVIAIPLPDVQSEEQIQWGDGSSPFLLSTIPNGELSASNPQNGAQTGLEVTNAVESSVPFAMELQQTAVGGGFPSIQSKEVVNPPTSFDAASTFPSMGPGFTEAISGASGSDSNKGSPGSDSNHGTEPAGGLAPDSSSSSPPPTRTPGSELPTAPDSILDRIPLDIKSIFDTPVYDVGS